MVTFKFLDSPRRPFTYAILRNLKKTSAKVPFYLKFVLKIDFSRKNPKIRKIEKNKLFSIFRIFSPSLFFEASFSEIDLKKS